MSEDKFVPNLSTRRRKQTEEQKQEHVPKPARGRGRGRGRGRREEIVTASGPFALGPAERNAKVKPQSSSTIIHHVKEEFMDVDHQLSSGIESEEEEEETVSACKISTVISDKNDISSVFKNDQIMFFQFPTILPFVDQQDQPLDQGLIKTEKHSILPSGEVGEYVIYKSGKMSIRFEDIEFDVSHAAKSSIGSQVVFIDKEQKELTILGNVSDKFVCAPNIESLLAI